MTEEKRPIATAQFLLTCPHCQGKFRGSLTRLQLKTYIKDVDKKQKKLNKERYGRKRK